MPLKEAPLATFHGDETFPIEWASETERDLFWVFDDLHCPHPLSPMFEDIGGWWLTCDHMFRRFGTPFASDWIAKNINGYLYTAAIPAEAGVKVATQEYGYEIDAVVPQDRSYPDGIGAYLGVVLPVYGAEFADWWRDRLVPEMDRNFAYLEEALDRRHEMSLARLAVLFEDAIDIHDRHWKIHWMLNFAQFSATQNLRAVMQETHGKVDDALLGRLQNSASDRNWDKIRALWEMKQEVKADPELDAAVRALDRRGDRGGPQGVGARHPVHRRARRALPARVRLARGLEPRVRVPDLPRADGPRPPARPRPGRRGLRLPDEDRRPAGRHRSRVARRSCAGSRARRWRRCARPTRSTSAWRRSRPTTTSTSTRARTRTSGSC